MCFYHDDYDYDWTAAISEKTELRSGPATTCDECGRKIGENEWREHLFQQESEGECLKCEATEKPCEHCPEQTEETDDPKCEHCGNWHSELCRCDHPDVGEVCEMDTCRQCCAILAAIKRVERDAGCPAYAQQPAVGQLGDVFREHQDAIEYAKRAVRLFPSLASHIFIAETLNDD